MSKRNEKTTVSEAKLAANILNAQLSTGPTTPEGKAKSKMNALRHGLTGQFYVMNEADRIAYEAFEKEMVSDLAPAGAVERQLALNITQNHWRLNRARALEYNVYGVAHEFHVDTVDADTAETEASITQAHTWLQHSQAISNLALYETRIERMIARNEKRLEVLQAKREAKEAEALKEAELLVCFDAMKCEETLPQDHKVEVGGFVFSAAKVFAGLRRKVALEEARHFEANGWDPSRRYSDARKSRILTANPLPMAA